MYIQLFKNEYMYVCSYNGTIYIHKEPDEEKASCPVLE